MRWWQVKLTHGRQPMLEDVERSLQDSKLMTTRKTAKGTVVVVAVRGPQWSVRRLDYHSRNRYIMYAVTKPPGLNFRQGDVCQTIPV